MIVLLMLCAMVYEYRGGVAGGPGRDVESSLSASNNNERRDEYANKNLVAEDRRAEVAQENDKELIEKAKGVAAAEPPQDKGSPPG